MPTLLIDPPSRYAPISEQEDFLLQMRSLPQNLPEVQAAVRLVEANLRHLRAIEANGRGE